MGSQPGDSNECPEELAKSHSPESESDDDDSDAANPVKVFTTINIFHSKQLYT